MVLKKTISLVFPMLLLFSGMAQTAFPVKVNGKWGLIDQYGKELIAAKYQGIGNFDYFGYASITDGTLLGIIDEKGNEIIPPTYIEVVPLSKSTFAVKVEKDEWNLVKTNLQFILPQNFFRLELKQEKLIEIGGESGIGMANLDGQILLPCEHENIRIIKEGFIVSKEGKYGFFSRTGTQLLACKYDNINPKSEQIFEVWEGNKLGVYFLKSQQQIQAEWQRLSFLGTNYLMLKNNQRVAIYNITQNQFLNTKSAENFYPYGDKHFLSLNQGKLGLIDLAGRQILPNNYNEIQLFTNGLFRVRMQNSKWGVTAPGGEWVIEAKYDFIAPSQTSVFVVKGEGKYGVCNIFGEEVIKPRYDQIYLEENVGKAYLNKTLKMLYFDDEGQLKEEDQFKNYATIKIGKPRNVVKRQLAQSSNPNLIENFEWFLSAEKGKWGLRDFSTGQIRIQPTYDNIKIERNNEFTIVGMESIQNHKIGRTNFRHGMVYGLVNNKFGLPITTLEFYDIRMSDFKDKKLPVARVVFNTGNHGLISQKGKILRRDYSYIGDFSEGKARASAKGALIGVFSQTPYALEKASEYLASMRSPYDLEDVTKYDKSFHKKGWIECNNCEWGFLDTTGQIAIPLKNEFVNSFKSGISIIQNNKVWGFMDQNGLTIVDPQFHKLEFLPNSQDKVLKSTVLTKRVGLIDSLGKTALGVNFNEIGQVCGDKIAIKKNGKWGFYTSFADQATFPITAEKILDYSEGIACIRKKRKWGFINKAGEIIIEPTYRTVLPFSEGLASAKKDRLFGFIDDTGKWIINPTFAETGSFHNGFCPVRIGKKWTLIDQSGNLVFKPKYKNISDCQSNGLAITKLPKNKPFFCILNQKGEIISSKKYQSIENYQEGLALVQRKMKYGFIDETGAEIIKTEYDLARPFYNGRAAVKKGTKWGFINKKGEIIVPLIYAKVHDFIESKTLVYTNYSKGAIVDLEGNINPDFDEEFMIGFTQNRALIKNQEGYYFVSEDHMQISEIFESATPFENGMAAVKKNGKWGLINLRYAEVITPKYEKITRRSNGFSEVEITTLHGLVDLNGEIIIPCEFEYIAQSGPEVYRVEKGGKVGYFHKSGTCIWGLQE